MMNNKRRTKPKPKYTVEKGSKHEEYEKELIDHMFRSPKSYRNFQEASNGKIVDNFSVQKINPYFIANEEI